MKYCSNCGLKLELKEVEHEGMVPFCSSCKEFHFPIFHSAVSMIVLNPQETKLLMIQQYGKPSNILVAGYINKTENAEEALVREMKEEIGRDILKYKFLKSEFFSKSNTLILNFAVMIDSECLDEVSEWEVDKAAWFSFQEAGTEVKQGSLAQKFLANFLRRYQKKTGNFFSD